MNPSSSQEEPAKPTDAPAKTTTAPASPPATPAPTAPATPDLSWPKWVEPVDLLMAFLVVALAFLVGSHAARNTDIWTHLATGRALVKGTYSFGTDPFALNPSQTSWVNHSWLYDLISYGLFTVESTGAALVAIKALMLAGVFAVILLMRRPGQVLWPWVLLCTLGVLAVAPNSGLRPLVPSALLFALSLYLLFATSWKADSWRKPILLGVIAWLWASIDIWFLLLPVTVLLTLLGEWMQTRMFPSQEPAGESEPALPLPALIKTLAITVVASSLTPHHIKVWQVPFELGFDVPPIVRQDNQFSIYVMSPLSEAYFGNPLLGKNVNGLTYALLLIASGAVLTFGYARLRLAYLFLWIFVAFLSVRHFRMILFFTVLVVPLLASALAQAVSRVTLGSAQLPATRLKLLASSVGRLLGLPLIIAMIVLTYPGWMHPPSNHAAYNNRLAWKIESDPGLVRTAKMMQEWREQGRLTDSMKGLNLSTSLGDYLTWYAPGEKVFVTSRMRLHASQLEDMARGSRILTSIDPNNPVDPQVLTEIIRKYDATYVSFSPSGFTPRLYNYEIVFNLLLPRLEGATDNPFDGQLLPPLFRLWHIDGRSFVLGDESARAKDPANYDAMEFDPVRLAFDPRQEPMPELPLPAPPTKPDDDVFAHFMTPPPPISVESFDAAIWHRLALKKTAERQALMRENMVARSLAAAVGGSVPGLFVPPMKPPSTDPIVALQILAVRAARRSIAVDPDNPDVYLALSGAAAAGGYVGFEARVPPDLRSPDKIEQNIVKYASSAPRPESLSPEGAGQMAEVAGMLSQLAMQIRNPQLAQYCQQLMQEYRFRLESFKQPLMVPGTSNEEVQEQFIVAARSCLDRMPAPELINPLFASQVASLADRLSVVYRQQRMYELARDMSRKSNDFSRHYQQYQMMISKDNEKAAKDQLAQIDSIAKERESEFTEMNNSLAQSTRGANTLGKLVFSAYAGMQQRPNMPPWEIPEGVSITLQAGLPDRVIREYREALKTDPKDILEAGPLLAVYIARLELQTGRLYIAAEDLFQIGLQIEALKANATSDPRKMQMLEIGYNQAVDTLNRLRGNYAGYGAALERETQNRPLTPEQKQIVQKAAISAQAWNAYTEGWLPGSVIGGPGSIVGMAVARNGTTPNAVALSTWSQTASFFMNRGRLLVLEGKITDAKMRFNQMLNTDGVDFPKFLPQRDAVDQFLRMIEHAEKVSKKGA